MPEAAHQILHDRVVGVGSLHLAVHILQYCPDKLNDSNDEAAKCNGAQMVPADRRQTLDLRGLSGTLNTLHYCDAWPRCKSQKLCKYTQCMSVTYTNLRLNIPGGPC